MRGNKVYEFSVLFFYSLQYFGDFRDSCRVFIKYDTVNNFASKSSFE